MNKFFTSLEQNLLVFTRLAVASSVGLVVLGLFLTPSSVHASGITMAPLEYKATINGSIKKGFVNVGNESPQTQTFTISIKAFKQVSNTGALTFYNDPLISAGITPDYQTFQLKPFEQMHLAFLINGHKLPKTRIFAALLAEATPIKGSYNITPILQVGTLLLLKNGNGDPPNRGAMSDFQIKTFQLGDGIAGKFDFQNTETGPKASGYFPGFTVSVAGASKRFSGNLVFPGIKRRQSFYLSGSHIGIYKLELTSNAGASISKRVVVLTGYWRWLLPLIIIALVVVIILFKRYFSSRKHNRQ